MHCDLDGPELYTWHEPVARKEHRCCECGSWILQGEQYFVAHGRWQGRFDTFRQHLDCCAACMTIRDDLNAGECIPFGCLLDWYHEFHADHRAARDDPRYQKFRSLMASILRRRRSQSRKA